MRDFGSAIAHLQTLRRKFEVLLEATRQKTARDRKAQAHRQTRLRELSGFGANPGNLRMFVYIPERLPRTAPMVVALHGCGQNAEEYDYGAGWSALADRLGFAVVYPEQQPANNPKNCFSWFVPHDIARGQGEALSIKEMAEHAIAKFGIDRRSVFVTGLSAGGAMASVMLATYPDIFAGGAIIAGLSYGCARSVQQAFEAMFTDQSHSAAALGDRVRSASRHRGPWPKISVWHGSADPMVKASNAEHVIRQWTDVHGLSVTPSYQELIGSHMRRVWTGADGEALIEAFSISNMAHGVPLETTIGDDNCGAVGAFFLDAGISSTCHIARFWRLDEDFAEKPRATEMVLEPHNLPTEGHAMVVAAQAASHRSDSAERLFDDARDERRRAYDPSHVIAAAFKAAGLPDPELPNGPPGAAMQVAPDSIVKAALKAAGLTRT